MFRAIILLINESFVVSMLYDIHALLRINPLSIKETTRSFIFQRLDGLEYFSVKRKNLSRNHHSQLSTSRASNQCNCDSRINSHSSKVSIFAALSNTKRLSFVGVKTMHLSLKFYGPK